MELQITDWVDIKKNITSEYGWISHEEWIDFELRRMNKFKQKKLYYVKEKIRQYGQERSKTWRAIFKEAEPRNHWKCHKKPEKMV